MRRSAAAVVAAAVVGLAGCGDEEPTGPEIVIEVIEEVTFDATLGIDLADYTELPSGVWIRDLTVGTGAVVAAGDQVSIDHSGWFIDGVLFSTGDFSFTHAASPRGVIEGFDIGMEGMAVGGMRRILIPPALGYGLENLYNQQGQLAFPGGKVLIFEVELISIP
jgi:FKBP-type peptidyl-prolyl cis-trans isomerase FkpA